MPEINNLKDKPHYLDLIAKWHQAEWSHLNPGETLEQRKARMQLYLSDTFIPSMYIALEQDRLLGTAAIVEQDMDSHPELSPWLASVYVAPYYRRRGIGTLLVKYVMQLAREKSLQNLYLFTPDQRAFYEKLGWQCFSQESYHDEHVSLMQFSV